LRESIADVERMLAEFDREPEPPVAAVGRR
jgi:hypothetical protein